MIRVKTTLKSSLNNLGVLDLSAKKWIMKQYWRIGQIRALTALATGMLVLGRWYYGYVPIIKDWGIIGALILGSFLFSIFLGVGWIYDIKLRQWSQSNQVLIEKNPYSYVPNFKNAAFEYQIFYAIASSYRKIMNKLKLDTKNIDDLALFMSDYYSYKPEKKDIDHCEKEGDSFLESHEFDPSNTYEMKKIPLSSRIKLAWELNVLRLNWIQALTGLIQDTLVFGILYVFVVFPFVSEENALWYAIMGISLPMFLILIIAGWFYDKKFRVWSANVAVNIDRNPYSYVMEPKMYAFILPFMNVMIDTLRSVMVKINLEPKEMTSLMGYLDEYARLSASRNQDLKYALDLRASLGVLFEKPQKEA